MSDYSTETKEQKLKVPYIEKMNGSISVKQGDWEKAINHYSKALFSLKCIFDGATETELVKTEE